MHAIAWHAVALVVCFSIVTDIRTRHTLSQVVGLPGSYESDGGGASSVEGGAGG